MGNTATIVVGKGLSIYEGVEDREYNERNEPVGYYVQWGNYQDFYGIDDGSEEYKALERDYAIRGYNRAIANFEYAINALSFARILNKSLNMMYSKSGIVFLHEDRAEWLFDGVKE